MKSASFEKIHAWRGWFLALYSVPVLLGFFLAKPSWQWMGFIPITLGVLLRLASGLYTHCETNGHYYSAPFLAQKGLYRISRNPLYLSNILACLGIIIWANLPYMWVNLIIFILVIFHHRIIIHGEEEWLQSRFKEEYSVYSQMVPRWIGIQPFFESIPWSPNQPLAYALKTQVPNVIKLFLLLTLIYIVQYVSISV